MSVHRMSDERAKALREGGLPVERVQRNLVAAFQAALQHHAGPLQRVLGYRPINRFNIRVTYTAPVWNDEPQYALLHRYTPGLATDQTETWSAVKLLDPDLKALKRGSEIVRFKVDRLTGEHVG